MNRANLVVVALVVLAAAGAGIFYMRSRGEEAAAHPHPSASGPSEHGVGMDQAMGAVRAQYDAPDGGTACETAYLAFKASQDYAAEHAVTAVVLWLAPRQEFLDRCGTLPETTQACLGPRYLARHRTECDRVKPAADVVSAMVKLKVASDPGNAEPGH